MKTQGKIKHVVLNEIPQEQITASLTRQMVFGEKGNIGIFVYKKGAVVPLHSHPNEQFTIITMGKVKVVAEGEEFIISAGEMIIIPANVHHSFEALEDDTYDIDFFSPRREDWLAKTDNYLGH